MPRRQRRSITKYKGLVDVVRCSWSAVRLFVLDESVWGGSPLFLRIGSFVGINETGLLAPSDTRLRIYFNNLTIIRIFPFFLFFEIYPNHIFNTFIFTHFLKVKPWDRTSMYIHSWLCYSNCTSIVHEQHYFSFSNWV